MRQALISVIIPTFNAASCLRRCLDSVLRQSHSHHEVIVVDDGSTDGTAEILGEYGDKIRHCHQENRGPSVARNQGLSLAQGEFVAFLDADDYWLPGFLSRCLEFFGKYPEADAVSTGQEIITWKGEIRINPPLLQSDQEKQKARLLFEFFRFWAEHDHIRTGSCMIRRALVERAGPMREDLRLAEDLEYWGYLATFGTWGFIPEVLWVCDGTPCAVSQGWLNKNRQRCQSCPTVETWQQRLAPRLHDCDWDGFRVVRGRVAQAYAYSALLGGDISGARHIVRTYGADFPANVVSRLLRWLAPRGLTAWKLMAQALLIREAIKGWRMQRSYYQRPCEISLSAN